MTEAQYPRGRSAEYYVRNRLFKIGAKIVTRSAGSHGHADLIAFFPIPRLIWLIQVKTSKRGVTEDKVEKDLVALRQLEGEWTVRAGYAIRTKEGWKANLPF